MGNSTSRFRPLLLTTSVLFIVVSVCGAQEAAPASSDAVLHLLNGDFVTGTLHPGDKPERLRWQSPAFAAPLEFDLDCVRIVQFPWRADAAPANGDYFLELAGGDALCGTLLGLDEEGAQLDVADLGRLHVRRSHIRLMRRRGENSGTLYVGPRGLTDWQAVSANTWRVELGQLLTDQPGAVLQGDFKLPSRASIEVEISWKRKADFVLALGVGPSGASVNEAFRLEAWDGKLVVLRELQHKADVAPVQTLPLAEGRLHVQILLDQEAGRCLVLSEQGIVLADLTLPPAVPSVWPGLRLINRRGDLRLERMSIARWSGAVPQEVAPDQSRLHLVDGSIRYGRIAGFDAAAQEFLVQGDTTRTRVAADRIDKVWLSRGLGPAATLRADRHDGMRLSGELLAVDDAAVWLTSPGVRDRMRLPLAGLRSLTVLRHDGASGAERVKGDAASAGPNAALLESSGVRLRGRLVDGREQPPASCLVWQPLGSSASSPLRVGASGRVVFGWDPPTRPPQPQPTPQRAQLEQLAELRRLEVELLQLRRQPGLRIPVGALAGGMPAASKPVPANPVPPKDGPHVLYLRTGDVIPCLITGVNEQGVSLKTALVNSTFVAHPMVQALELHQDPPISISKTKRDRLLTLPRMQRDNPPTHLIRSREGDYLRCRIVDMDDGRLRVELRLETKELPLDSVSRIIWLHGEEPASGRPAAEPSATRVQAVPSDGNRLTILAEQLIGATLSGRSPVLGACQIELGKVGQLLFGSSIEESAAQLAYQQWKLQPALEPQVAQDDAGDRPPGTESDLVGKPAPDFELDLLDGKRFRLSTTRGKIVVLEFWATWCGPCLRALPQVAQVAQDFADRDVQVVAINLAETREAITAMLHRHKLHLTVALDRDGAVAARYGIKSIPQTLIIDSQGAVFRHFIGDGPKPGDQLSLSLQTLLAETP